MPPGRASLLQDLEATMTAAPNFSHMTDVPVHLDGVGVSNYQSLYPPAPVAFDGQTMYQQQQQQQQQPADSIPEQRPAYPTPNMETEEELDTEIFTCQVCNRNFIRHCDLNKHLRRHSRPFKCPDRTCDYNEMGWPTAQELERHVSDKHTDRPHFACLYCSHASKRESNVKQHMEKAHGWNYVRSRSARSYRCPVAGCSECSTPNDSRQRHGDLRQATPPSAATQQNVSDMVLFADGISPTTPAIQSAGSYSQAPNQSIWDSYVPWESPPTRGESIYKCLRSVDNMINHPLPLDPRLTPAAQYPQVAQHLYSPEANESQFLSVQEPGLAPGLKLSRSPPAYVLANSEHRLPAASNAVASNEGDSPYKPHMAAGARGSGSGLAYSPPTLYPHRATPDGTVFLKEEEDEDDGDEDEDDDGEPPNKRQRTGAEDDFDDDKMPCPFRLLDPEFFDRNNKEKFSPCHTRHKDISTIVRHLSRPAHQLDVSERYVSSFETLDVDNPCLRGGLCRKCWRIYRDKQEFERHIQQACTKVSRGKREKFELLYKTFCFDSAQEESRRPSLRQSLPAQEDILVEPASLDPTPTTHDAGSRAAVPIWSEISASEPLPRRHAMSEEAPVTRREHEALAEKIRGLKKTFKLILEAMSVGRDAEDVSRHEHDVDMDNRTEDARDRESLVSGMDSRPINVDRDRLLFEAQRTLSGLSSSSDRSSVRHVPLSPRLKSPKDRTTRLAGAGLVTPAKHSRSYSDSGYGSSSTKENTRVKQGVSTDLEVVQEQREVGGELLNESQVASTDFFQEMPEAGTTDIDALWDN